MSRIVTLLSGTIATLPLISCVVADEEISLGDAESSLTGPPVLLDPSLPGWDADNRDRLNQLIIDHRPVGNQCGARRPVAVFDWDNTMVKNDIGDATFFWMIQHDKILQPPGRNWAKTSPHLTPEAVAALDSACGPLASPGAPVPTSTNAACANEIVAIYDSGKTHAGVTAWVDQITYYNNTAYQWVAQLQAGYRPHQINAF